MTYRLPLYRHGKIIGQTLVDDEDRILVESARWTIDKTGYATRTEYIRGSGRKHQKSRRYRLHRLLMNLGPYEQDKREIDHINRDRLDNRRNNLRIVTHAEQAQNRNMVAPWRGRRTSRYRGVSWSAHAKRWTIRVWHQGKNINGGYFDTEQEANAAAIALRHRLMPLADSPR